MRHYNVIKAKSVEEDLEEIANYIAEDNQKLHLFPLLALNEIMHKLMHNKFLVDMYILFKF